MIKAYFHDNLLEPKKITFEDEKLLKEAMWIDLFDPSKEEKNIVEQCLGFKIPTRAEMMAIELSSRFRKEHDLIFMTITMFAQSYGLDSTVDPITCVVSKNQFITIRYIEPQAFELFISHLKKNTKSLNDMILLFIEFLEASVYSLADVLECIGSSLDEYSKIIFHSQTKGIAKLNYQKLVKQIGTNNDLNTKTRESLVAFNRVIPFFEQAADKKINKDKKLRLEILSKDVNSLSDHATFISNEVTFLLEATLGMVTIEQNNVIRIVSVAAVLFLPPTLIASIYGMNFHMPELSWRFGYLYAIIAMIFASLLTYIIFKNRKWL